MLLSRSVVFKGVVQSCHRNFQYDIYTLTQNCLDSIP